MLQVLMKYNVFWQQFLILIKKKNVKIVFSEIIKPII
jgi:hypothetical protein